jgi:hypothetical protein
MITDQPERYWEWLIHRGADAGGDVVRGNRRAAGRAGLRRLLAGSQPAAEGRGCQQTILVRRATAAGQSSLSPHRTFVPLAGLHRLNPQVTGLCPARTSQVPGRRTRPDCRPCQRQLTTRDQRRRTRAAARRAESEVQLADAYV